MVFSFLSPIPTLPEYPGPFTVGSTEIEIPVSEIPSPSPVPDASISTIKFRVFYPTSATSGQALRWLPQPQNQWMEAYALFLGASARVAKFFANSPTPLKYASMPAITDTAILPPTEGDNYPVVIFSHGLGGNFNAYSSILGSLASCGIVCIAPEHRDQSCPVTLIRQTDGTTISKPYQRHSHSPSPEVLAARNAQLRIRLWELELLYSAVEQLDSSNDITNLAQQTTPSFRGLLDLSPGNVTWAGHSFGAASIVQLTKSVFWHQSLPAVPAKHADNPDWKPLYTPAENSALSKQITAQSPTVLMDLWTMPLREQSTEWLWSKPLPCWTAPRSNVIAIMSEEFYKWTDLLTRTKALLSATPNSPAPQQQQTTDPPKPNPQSPRLFFAPKSAHLSQSDFGCLFPWVTRYLMKAEQPERTIGLNVRAVLQLFRERGVHVEAPVKGRTVLPGAGWGGGEKDGVVVGDDREILASDAVVEGWTPVPLTG